MRTASNKNAVITGLDIIKGLTTKKGATNGNAFNLMDAQPIHWMDMDEKDEDWKKWVSDYFDLYGWNQVTRNHKKVIKNRKLVAGELDMEDYIVNPDQNELADMIGIIHNENNDPLKQFFPLIPTIINILRGEFIQKDNRILVKAMDQFSVAEALQSKEDQFREILKQKALTDRDAALQAMGLSPDDSDPEKSQQYNAEMEAANKAIEIESQFKNFRSEAEKWGQGVLNINRQDQGMDYLEEAGFVESLTNSKVYYHIDMKENGFKTELLDNAFVFSHQSPNVRFASDGDFIGWFEYATLGDIINKFGDHPDMTEKMLEKLKDTMSSQSIGMLIPNHQRNLPGAYYDTTKPYPLGGNVDRNFAEGIAQWNVEEMFKGPSSKMYNHYVKQDIGDPRMFRIMRAYVKSLRKMGYLTKVNRAGETEFQGWVDENFKMTIEPVYDHSIIKTKRKDNLLYGEHIDWTRVNEWRHFVKISNNMEHAFWRAKGPQEPIYLDGEPCKFQFKGDNPYECLPPIEGCEFKIQGVRPISFVDRAKPWQIIANIAGNKVPKTLSQDLGIALAINRQMIPRDYMDKAVDLDPIAAYIDNIRENGIVDYSTTKEQMESSQGQPIAPQAVNLSRVQDAMLNINLYQMAKEEMFETVGVSRQRRAQAKPYENQTNIQSGIEFSETQTLPYFNQFSNELMSRVYQRQLEASQYYASTQETAAAYYMTSQEQNAYLEIAGQKLLHRHFHIYAQSHPRIKEIEKQLKNMLLNDPTIQMDVIDKAEGLLAETSTKYMEQMRRRRAELEQQEQERFEKEQETAKFQSEAQLQSAREQREYDMIKQQRELDSKERIASMQAATSAEPAQGLVDPKDAVSNALKNRQIDLQYQSNIDRLGLDRQKHVDDVLVKKQANDVKLKSKEIDLKIAKENKVGEK